MSATYEGMSPGGHETYATSIFSKIKTYLDSNPYGYVTKNTTYRLSASGESVVLTGSDNSSKSVSLGAQLLPNLPVWTAEPTDNVYLIRRDIAGGNAYGQVKFSTVWNYIKRKADSVYVYTAGDNMTLSSNAFYATKRWNAVTQGLKWSRIMLVSNTVGVEGNSGLLHVACTRGNTVCNSTFLINTSHSSYGQITELGANNYSKFKVRLVVNSNGNYYVEIYDTASSITSGTTQTWHCSFLSFQPATITAYTTFTDGTTVPSGYTAKGEMETVLGDSALAIRNITRSGTTFTATRQNGTTFTFTQQDNDHYAWSNITSKPTTISGYGITDAKIASGVITLGSNTITPLTASSTLDATKLSGTIPSSCYTDTKNTAGSTDTSSKIFLIGATSQAANPQTYSQDTAYVGTDGCLYSGGTKVLTAHQDISGKADTDDLARGYSSDTVQLYNTGDLVYYDGDLYRCINGTSGGNWMPSCWQHTRVATELENKIEGISVAGSSGGSYQSEITTSIWFDPNQFNYITGSHKVELNSNFDPSNKVSKTGDTMTGALIMSTANFAPASGKDSTLTAGTSKLYKNGLVISNPATANDQGWIRVLGTAESDTILEIATGDDGGTGEQIVARQYNTSNAVAHQVILLDTSGNFRCGNTTIYSSGSNGGRNSMIIGDDCKLGDCNVGGMLGLQANSGTNCGIRLYNGSGGLIGGFQSTNGTPQWINSSGTATTISLAGHGHSYLPLSGGTLTGATAMKDSNIFRTRLISRNDTGDSGYINFVNTANSAYAPVRSSNFTTMSCKHTKTNIVDISEEDALKLLNIRPVNFDYVEEVGGQKNQIGVLAEDTYEILPKVVSVPDDYVEEDFDISKGIHQPLPSVDYAKFVPYLIKMVQIQQKEIDILKEKISI